MEKQKRKYGDPRPNPLMLILSFFWTLIKAIFSGIGWASQHVINGIRWAIQSGASGAWYGVQQAGQVLWWFAKQPYRLLRYILNGRIPQFETVREEEIFWRIKRRFRRQRIFLLNALGFGASLVVGASVAIIGYQNWQSAIARSDEFIRFYRSGFYNDLFAVASITGVWMVILIGHFIFNKMGNSEDNAMKEAFDEEYRRITYQKPEHIPALQHPPIGRLIDNAYQDDEPYFDDNESKPKRNGARL
ncbi:MAG: hypothetical protein WBC91_00575 [Phototrophicaceae bacterium]